ncbi:OmpA family protein [Celeribacter sp.]|uniref:OmpA family protein n=1 Tax=Celeribacter sp. TaxID=1890673 RepID=UPI003A913C2A
MKRNLGVPTVILSVLSAWLAVSAVALDLPASALLTASNVQTKETVFPVTAFHNGTATFDTAKGQITKRSYKVAGSSLTSFQLIEPIKAQLQADGFSIAFACADTVCGGYDFRYALDLLPPPHMFVDLGDFQYILAIHDDGRRVSVVTSRAAQAGFIQLTTVTPKGGVIADTPRATIPMVQVNPTSDLPLIAQLTEVGHVPLDDLAFETGSAQLGAGPFASLSTLAGYLRDTPDARVVLVGHTDNVGGLAGNVTLSKQRAASVRARLIDAHGVEAEQLGADGVGYLAPRTTNATTVGRNSNRRVEAILAPTR